jgi:hypothetical protein
MLCDIFANAPTCFAPAPSGGACNPDLLLPCADFREHCDSSMKCVGALPAGSTCMYNSECRPDHSCVGTCMPNAGAGGSCPQDGVDCLGDLDCTNSVCTAPAAGMSCL